jgi:GTP-binding protein HflX
LVKAFRATLEEVVEAQMILHIVDAASPHRREQMREVDRLLTELGAHEKPQILVLNKADLIGPEAAQAFVEAERTAGGRAGVAAISAREGVGLDELARTIEAALPADSLQVCRFRFPHGRGDLLSFLYDHARVLERKDEGDAVEVTAEAAESVRRRLEPFALQATGARP